MGCHTSIDLICLVKSNTLQRNLQTGPALVPAWKRVFRFQVSVMFGVELRTTRTHPSHNINTMKPNNDRMMKPLHPLPNAILGQETSCEP